MCENKYAPFKGNSTLVIKLWGKFVFIPQYSFKRAFLLWKNLLLDKSTVFIKVFPQFFRFLHSIRWLFAFCFFVCAIAWLRLFRINLGSRHSLISGVLISAIFDLTRFIIIFYFRPLSNLDLRGFPFPRFFVCPHIYNVNHGIPVVWFVLSFSFIWSY